MRPRAGGARGRSSCAAPPPRQRRDALEVDALDLAPAHPLDDDAESAERELLAVARHAAEVLVDETADRRHVLGLELLPQRLRELVDRETAGDPVAAAVEPRLDLGLLDVVLVADVADDLLEHVLDRDETG